MAKLRFKRMALFWALLAACVPLGCKKSDSPSTAGQAGPAEVRIGYFANLTHAQAVLGIASGEFADAVKPATVRAKVFNAGPSLIEAVLAGEVDLGYVGPGPALNAHQKTRGRGIRVLAGATANGVVIVARKDSGIEKLQDLAGRRIATPQHGNTQDIAARYYLSHTLGQKEVGKVLPVPNAEQAGLMSRGEIDAAWAPEPWGSRLVAEAGAKVIGEEKDLWPGGQFILTLVITTPEFLQRRPDTVRSILRVHHAWTVRLQQDPQMYLPRLEEALLALSGKNMPPGVMAGALRRVRFTDDPMEPTIRTMADWAYELKFAPQPANLSYLIDGKILQEVRAADAK